MNEFRASSLERYQLCPGSWWACIDLESQSSKAADLGTRVHAAHSDSKQVSKLSPEELEIYEAQKAGVEVLKAELLSGDVGEIREEECVFPIDNEHEVSGHPDLIIVGQGAKDSVVDNQRVALVVDYKTGWKTVTGAARNLQLRAYARMAREMVRVDAVIVAIVPRSGKVTEVAVYSPGQLGEAFVEISGIVKGAADRNAKRIPSTKACEYCPAAGTPKCPESRAVVTNEVKAIDFSQLTGQQIADRLDVFSLAKKIMAREEEVYREMLAQDPGAIPGWQLKPGRINREVDTLAAWQALNGYLTPEQFAASCKVKLGEMKGALKKVVDSKGKAFDGRWKTFLSQCSTEKQTRPVLCKIGAMDVEAEELT